MITNEKGQEGGRLVEKGPELQVCREFLQFFKVLYNLAPSRTQFVTLTP